MGGFSKFGSSPDFQGDYSSPPIFRGERQAVSFRVTDVTGKGMMKVEGWYEFFAPQKKQNFSFQKFLLGQWLTFLKNFWGLGIFSREKQVVQTFILGSKWEMWIFQGLVRYTRVKGRWHSYHVLVYISPLLTYLLGTVPLGVWTNFPNRGQYDDYDLELFAAWVIWAMKKRALGWLGYIGDEKLPSYIGILINPYKDPY